MIKDNYYKVYDFMVSELQLTGNTLHVFALLYGLCEANNGEAAVSNSYIMMRTGLSLPTILKSLAELLNAQLVVRFAGGEGGRGSKSVYRMSEKRVKKKGNETLPFTAEKRVKNFNKKGKETLPQTLILNDIKLSSSTAPAHTREESVVQMVLSWLTDNELFLGLLLKDCKLLTKPVSDGELVQIVTPYVQEFVHGELIHGTDFDMKGRQDTKRHFADWLRKYQSKRLTTDNNGDLLERIKRAAELGRQGIAI